MLSIQRSLDLYNVYTDWFNALENTSSTTSASTGTDFEGLSTESVLERCFIKKAVYCYDWYLSFDEFDYIINPNPFSLYTPEYEKWETQRLNRFYIECMEKVVDFTDDDADVENETVLEWAEHAEYYRNLIASRKKIQWWLSPPSTDPPPSSPPSSSSTPTWLHLKNYKKILRNIV